MDDPFFASADPFFSSSGNVSAIPVRATRALEKNDDDDESYPPRGRNWREDKKRTKETDKRQKERSQISTKGSDAKSKPKPYCENKRMPSMLNDVVSPKPLKIYANKPPNAKKFFNVQMPEQWTYATPYDE